MKTLTQSTTRALARSLMNQHGLQDWTFTYDHAKCRAGICRYSRKTIQLSIHFVQRNSDEEITDTILHEIAHAIAGYKAGHGPEWKAVCRRIGAKPIRCYDSEKVDMPKGKYSAKCPSCAKEFTKHKKVTRKYHCIACGPDRGQLQYQETRVLSTWQPPVYATGGIELKPKKIL